MKKIFIVLSLYCLSSISTSECKIEPVEINRSLLMGIGASLQKGSNIASSLLALGAHNHFSKRSSNLLDLRDSHILACLVGGWVGDALNNALDKTRVPSVVKTALNHPFATSWLLYNVIAKKSAVVQDPASWAVGGYLFLNWVDRYWNKVPWPFDGFQLR